MIPRFWRSRILAIFLFSALAAAAAAAPAAETAPPTTPAGKVFAA